MDFLTDRIGGILGMSTMMTGFPTWGMRYAKGSSSTGLRSSVFPSSSEDIRAVIRWRGHRLRKAMYAMREGVGGSMAQDVGWTPGGLVLQRSSHHYDGKTCWFCGKALQGFNQSGPSHPLSEGRLICHRLACFAKAKNEKLRVARAQGRLPMPAIPVGATVCRVPILGTRVE